MKKKLPAIAPLTVPKVDISEVGEKLSEQLDNLRPKSLQEEMNALRRTGRFMRFLFTAVRVLLLLAMIAVAVMMAACLFVPEDIDHILGIAGVTSTVATVLAMANLPFIAEIELTYRLLIELFLLFLALFLLQALARFLTRIIHDITEDGKPFEDRTVKLLRRFALLSLLFGLWNLPMALIIAVLAFLFSHVFAYGVYLQDKADENARIQENVILSFAEITEAKSGQTGQHVRRVSEYTRILAAALGLSPEEIEKLRIAAMMHDVGKLIVPTEILEKPGRLTDEEFAIIKTHTSYGEELLAGTTGDILKTARLVAAEHHERWDGRGYHRGLSGEEISLPARIVAVADVYDALTSRRSYKDAWDPKKAYDEILRGRGTQFDPAVVDAFTDAYGQIEAARQKYADAPSARREQTSSA